MKKFKSIRSNFLMNATLTNLFMSIILTIIAIISVSNISSTHLLREEALIYENYDLLIKTQVESVINVAEVFHSRYDSGELTYEEAKERTANIIRKMRYNGDGYFWVDEGSTGINIVSNDPSVEGTKRNITDDKGRQLVELFISNGKQYGGGFTDYSFPKPGTNIPLQKRCYSKYFESFDWVVSTGNYVEDIENKILTIKEEATSTKTIIIIIMIVVSFVITIFNILLSYFLSNKIIKSINKLVEIIKQLSCGDFEMTSQAIEENELGILKEGMFKSMINIQSLVNDLTYVSKCHKEGKTDINLDPLKYSGTYGTLVESINQMLQEYSKIQYETIKSITAITNGNFDISVPKFDGKLIAITNMIENLKTELININTQINNLIYNSKNGDLYTRIDTTKFKGDWAKLTNGLNEVMEAIAIPVKEISLVMQGMEKDGNFHTFIKGDYQGEFLLMKEAFNSMLKLNGGYIVEVTNIINGIADKNIDFTIKENYIGDFKEMGKSMDVVLDNLNVIIYDIISSAEQTTAGSRQVSESSIILAQGATEQASAIQEINATMNEINETSHKNAENAEKAKELVVQSNEHVTSGNENMRKMLIAMESIKDASSNIYNIIKTIDDIAFQTNLLALNAAVEAARAGQSGKGFSVVAEEVRTLAARSKEAAHETSTLIETSIQKVNEGVSIAEKTALGLDQITKSISEVSDIIKEITDESKNQSEKVEQVNSQINDISGIVQTNSATAEEEAAASEELSAQSEVLLKMVNGFQVRRNYN